MRSRKRKRKSNARRETGQAMSEYIIVSLGLVLALIAAINAVDLVLTHHERASATMQLPL
ncbi:MAG: hypothetical protein ACR2QZ_03555 [Woeseiaceae bacterium]